MIYLETMIEMMQSEPPDGPQSLRKGNSSLPGEGQMMKAWILKLWKAAGGKYTTDEEGSSK